MPRAARTGVLVLTVPVLVVLAIAATSLLASDDSSAGGRAGGLVIAGFAFNPETLRIDADEAIRVTNDDDATHTVTAEDGSFDTGEIEGGGHARITVAGSGETAYFCRIHQSMRGTIEIAG